MRFRVTVEILLLPELIDPQGQVVHRALHRLGYKSVQDVRVGKTIVVELEVSSAEEARRQVEAMCGEVLANPVVERAEIVRVEPVG